MRKQLLGGALLALCALGLGDTLMGHGGTYRGPGDTVPPGGSGGSNAPGGTPGASGPSGPVPGGPSTSTPGGPGVPGPGQRSGPVTGGPGTGADLTQWQFWWGFNQARYLNLQRHIHNAAPGTGTDDYFLGHGQREGAKDLSLRPSERTIRESIVPALVRALETEHHNDLLTGALIALAKIGDEQSEDGSSPFERLFLPFLRSPSQEVAETAAIALGVLGNPASIDPLRSLLLDEPRGRELVGSEAGVDDRVRAFAAYGLGQIGNRTEEPELRRRIVQILWQVCESPRARTRDVKVAAVIAMGLVPLDHTAPSQDEPAGDAAPSNREEQIGYLLRFFSATRDRNKPFLVRAHAPRAIARLLNGLRDKAPKRLVVETLAPFVTKRGNGGQRELRQSAVLAFGMLGDLDLDPADVLIRERLNESLGNADLQVKHFSMIALGQVGGRPGSGEEALAAVAEVRKRLLLQLARGITQIRPWAGLAIGVMERGLLDRGYASSASSLASLREALRSSRTRREVGAFAIACGIAGDSDAGGILLDKLEHMAADEVRGHLAIGLGLIKARDAIEPIQRVVQASQYRGALLKQAAVALGLLGDKQLVGNLVGLLAEAKTLSSRAAIASALGTIGDSKSVQPLLALLGDKRVTGAARGFAAAALGIVADKEPLPWNAKFSIDINYRANTSTLTNGASSGLLDLL